MIINGRLLVAEESKMLTNGETFGKRVYLGVNDSVDNWQEITEEEYTEAMKQVVNEEWV